MCNAPMKGVKRMWRGGEARPKAPSKVKTAFGRSRRADARCKMCSGAPEALLHPCKTCLGTPDVLLRHEKRVRARPNSYCNAATAVLTCRNTFIHEEERLLCVWGLLCHKVHREMVISLGRHRTVGGHMDAVFQIDDHLIVARSGWNVEPIGVFTQTGREESIG